MARQCLGNLSGSGIHQDDGTIVQGQGSHLSIAGNRYGIRHIGKRITFTELERRRTLPDLDGTKATRGQEVTVGTKR